MRLLRNIGLGVAAVGGAAALLGGAGYGAAIGLARSAARVESGRARPVKVVRLIRGTPDRVWVRGEGVRALGAHSLLFDAPGVVSSGDPSGHARLGPALERRGDTVLREVVAVDRGTLVAGVQGRMVGWWYTSPDEFGYRTEKIQYASECGPMDAWIVHPKRAKKKRYAIHVHGRGARPEETLRGIAPLARAGITSIVISYRNDAGQPAGLNSRYGMGISEARDIDAAIAEAVDRGAERVTLVGWSMGGTASLVAAGRGKFRNYIDGLVLDSPGSDWPEILRAHAAARGVPRWIAAAGMRLLARGVVSSGEEHGLDLATLTPESFAAELAVPVLLLAGPDDRFVPWEGSKRLAEIRPDLVRFVSVAGGGHVRLWNVDPEAWEQAVLTFVAALPRPGWRGQ